MTSKRPTITDVAHLAGVSKATVSAVLNDTGTVKESTRERIMTVIDHLNYRPTTGSGRSALDRCIALIIKEIDNPYYDEILVGARACAREHGYAMLVTSSEGEYEAERNAVELLQAKDVEGVIITPTVDADTDLSHLFELKRRNFPFVLLEEIRGVQASLVDVDNVEASRAAVQFLIEQGHTRIVHFAGPGYSTHTVERVDGVRRACSGSSVIFTDDDIVPTGAHMEDGYRRGLEYFGQTRDSRPTAVTCYNDLVALGLCRALAELGLRVPDDVSVIGYDNIRMLDFIPVQLTSVDVPKWQMGWTAAELLVKQIESSEALPPQKVYLEAQLIKRQSTRAIEDIPALATFTP